MERPAHRYRPIPPKRGDGGAAYPTAWARSWIVRLLVTTRERRHRRREWSTNRAAFRTLLSLDEAILLSDIGVTRADVVRASRLPLRVDASSELREVARVRRGTERRDRAFRVRPDACFRSLELSAGEDGRRDEHTPYADRSRARRGPCQPGASA